MNCCETFAQVFDKVDSTVIDRAQGLESNGNKLVAVQKVVVFGDLSRSRQFRRCSCHRFVACRYDEATVSIMVASHTRLRPPRHGINVSPSGLFPSVRESPGGSLMFGIPACVRPLLMMSFMVACLAIQPGPRPHDRPCEPFAVTVVPQRQVWGSHIIVPNRRPTTTRIVSSSICSPHDEIGSANSQSPA